MDRHSEMLGWKKEYLICQATNLLGLAVGELNFGIKESEDENIASITEMLEAYPFGKHYFAQSNIDGAYEDFIKESFPNTIQLIRAAVKNGRLDDDKWLPLLTLFFNTAKAYIAEYNNNKE